ncbi:MAG: ribonuclease III domain-containing protein [Candidatus Izemoplasmatales bacterium]
MLRQTATAPNWSGATSSDVVPYNGATLAYVGDAVYELRVREHLLARGLTKTDDLHRAAIRFTSAQGEAAAADRLLSDILTEEETDVYKRGRNAPASHTPKNADPATYHRASGLEALFGFLYLEGRRERLDELLSAAIAAVEELL